MLYPLDGIKVLELGWWVAIPAAAALLGEWGADVIKIEDLQGGDPTRAAVSQLGKTRARYFWALDNRNKRSMALNLKQKKGVGIAHLLVQQSDLFLTSFGEPTLKSLEMDYHTLVQVNPRIVYVRLTAYGTKGPDAHKGGFDYGAYWARSGTMAVMGEPHAPPPTQRPAYGDHNVSMCLTTGALLGLMARDKTGKGLEINISLQSAGMWATSRDIQACLTTGEDVPRLSRKEAVNPLFNPYKTKDGRWIFLTMPQTDLFWSSFCHAISAKELENDTRYDSHEHRCENNVGLIDALDTVIVKKTLSEWADIFELGGLLWAPIQSPLEVIHDPQTIANDYIISFDHPSQGVVKLVGSPVQFNGVQPEVKRAAPELGEGTEEILLELGFDWSDITQLKEQGVII